MSDRRLALAKVLVWGAICVPPVLGIPGARGVLLGGGEVLGLAELVVLTALERGADDEADQVNVRPTSWEARRWRAGAGPPTATATCSRRRRRSTAVAGDQGLVDGERLPVGRAGVRTDGRCPRRPSETDVRLIRLVAGELSDREIGTALHLPPHTVAHHVGRLARLVGSGTEPKNKGG